MLGSFWSGTFGGADQVRAYCDGLGRLCNQSNADLTEAFEALSYQTVPVFHTEEWWSLFVLQSQLKLPVRGVYDGGYLYDGSHLYDETDAVAGLVVPLPNAVTAVPLIFNHLSTATLSLCDGLDYLYIPADMVGNPPHLRFLTNLFDDPRWNAQPVYDGSGNVVDQQLTLWLFRPTFDRDVIANIYGTVLGLVQPSSQAYLGLVQAFWEALVSGTCGDVLVRLLEAITGVPAARAGETVLAIGRDDRGRAVLTDQRAYRLPGNATVLVTVGDVLTDGQSLCDTYQVFEPNRGSLPASLRALAVGPGVLANGYVGDLSFSNQVLPTTVSTDFDGSVRITFPISGFPADVTKFWNSVQAAGKRAGKTFAQLLDVRGDGATTAPSPITLPAAVNPLQFLARNFLSSNCFVIVLNTGSLPSPLPELFSLGLLRRIVPPAIMVFIVVNVSFPPDSVTMVDTQTVTALPVAAFATDLKTAQSSWDGPPSAKSVTRVIQG